MTKLPVTLGAFALIFAAATPAVAADSMITKAQMSTLAKCKAQSKKSAKCAAFIKAHPESSMQAEGAMMSDGGGMMSAEKPKN
ncbi:hypothetical protein [Sphingomonas psychrolutea]|uniref:PsiF repeat-containing protein n=1 Tax=Sphingomonas psychrolutea TaxID=1259676 RepID=A0ABQ1G6X5_9SPHN|nr:hypothetical protein [Sphingomonas psychrolutea]GGA37922.1 hypothetical protein GCM10011395_05300 [Sphingomonas psychrolutea]